MDPIQMGIPMRKEVFLMKKTMVFLVALVLMLTPILSLAAVVHEDVLQPKANYKQNISATLTISGNTAICRGAFDPSGSYSCTISVTLYKNVGGSLVYQTSWGGSGSGGGQASAGGSYSIGSGTYTVITRGTVIGTPEGNVTYSDSDTKTK